MSMGLFKKGSMVEVGVGSVRILQGVTLKSILT